MGGVATGDLVVDVLSAILWDENFTALPSTTWATAQSQVQRTTLSNTYNHVGNQLVSTKAGSGTVNVGYTPSAGKPGFVYFAFIVKSSAGGPVANPGLRLKVQDRLGAAEPNGSGFTVVARTGISATSVLYTTSAAAVASGLIEIDSDAIGSIGAVVHVAVAKQGASIPLDKNAAGRATVVDLNTADES